MLRGGITIHGGVFVDGNGGVDVGSNKVNVNFLNAAFDLIGTYGAAGWYRTRGARFLRLSTDAPAAPCRR